MDPKLVGVGLVTFVCGFGLAIGVSTLSDGSELTIADLNARVAAAATAAGDKQAEISKLTAEVDSLRVKADGNAAAAQVTELQAELAAVRASAERKLETSLAGAKDRISRLEQELADNNAMLVRMNQAKSQATPPAGVSPDDGAAQRADGFMCYNVRFTDDRVIGEIKNGSGKDSQIATFTLTLYDGGGGLLEVVDVIVPNLKDGKSQPFSSRLEAPLPADGRYTFNVSTAL